MPRRGVSGRLGGVRRWSCGIKWTMGWWLRRHKRGTYRNRPLSCLPSQTDSAADAGRRGHVGDHLSPDTQASPIFVIHVIESTRTPTFERLGSRTPVGLADREAIKAIKRCRRREGTTTCPQRRGAQIAACKYLFDDPGGMCEGWLFLS